MGRDDVFIGSAAHVKHSFRLRQLGGMRDPIVCAGKGAVAAAGSDEFHNGERLRDLLWARSIRDSVVPTGQLRRIILVR